MRTLISIFLLLSITLTVKSQDNTIDERVIIEEISTDKSYGFKPKTNIKVGSLRNEYAFIAQLTGPNGEEITANRLAKLAQVFSMCETCATQYIVYNWAQVSPSWRKSSANEFACARLVPHNI